jgi:hypothetical protein
MGMQRPKKVLTTNLSYLAYFSFMTFVFNLQFIRTSSAPLLYFVIALLLGMPVGLFIQRRHVKKKLQRVEQEGYYKPKTQPNIPGRLGVQLLIISLLGFLMIIALLIYVAAKAPFWLFTLNTVSGFIITFGITERVCYWRWQHKNKRVLLMADNILYPYPYMNQPTNKEAAL